MGLENDYRVKAAEMNARAGRESNPNLRIAFQNLGLSYLRLANQAERNARNDIVYETPPRQLQAEEEQNSPVGKSLKAERCSWINSHRVSWGRCS